MNALALKRNYQLQLPNSFVDVDSEEMEYVDGGGIGYNWYNSSNFVALTLDVIIVAVSGGITIYSAYQAHKYIRSIIGTTVTRTIARKLAGYVGSTVASLFSASLDIALTITGSSIGSIIAEAMDRIDGKNDGFIYA